jgi:hypothetical protein
MLKVPGAMSIATLEAKSVSNEPVGPSQPLILSRMHGTAKARYLTFRFGKSPDLVLKNSVKSMNSCIGSRVSRPLSFDPYE